MNNKLLDAIKNRKVEPIELQMLKKLEEARNVSRTTGTVWAMSNGTDITYTCDETAVADLKAIGYWMCYIFESGLVISL